MSFATQYFTRFKCKSKIFSNNPCRDTGIIVVIPCYDDKFIFQTLASLETAINPIVKLELIVVVNSSAITPNSIIEENRRIYKELDTKAKSNFYQTFQLLAVIVEDLPKKIAGVGYARKLGMDEAVRRFDYLGNSEGIIVSLDADSLVAEQYFVEIEKCFLENEKSSACVLQFKHDYNIDLYSPDVINACKLYEIYLRYFKLALKTTGFPYAFHTIGSCFAVKAKAYIKVGGMSRRQGGEDFYFLHKLAQISKILEVNKPVVFPSPRISYRVPFGTGPAVAEIIKDGVYNVYNFQLFGLLKHFYENFELLFDDTYAKNLISVEIISFVGEEKLYEIISECKSNTNSLEAFKKRMFSKFDAFFVVKFLNSFGESSAFPPQDALLSSIELLNSYQQNTVDVAIDKVYEGVFDLDLKNNRLNGQYGC